ncbi:MAG: hypothetical protein IKD45_02685 [Clostridia bacterium]|nr:hypothetical protein [Clostridia bacterium]
MKNYETPVLELEKFSTEDIIVTSGGMDSEGTVTTPQAYTNGVWSFGN